MLFKAYSDSNKITGKGMKNLVNVKFNNLISISLSFCYFTLANNRIGTSGMKMLIKLNLPSI